MTRDRVATDFGIDDFECAPIDQRGGLGKVNQLLGAELPRVIEALNKELAA